MIVFDLDDTLYKEHHYVLSGYYAVAKQIAMETGQPAQSILARMLASSDPMAMAAKIGPQPIDVYIQFYRNHYPSIALDPQHSISSAC